MREFVVRLAHFNSPELRNVAAEGVYISSSFLTDHRDSMANGFRARFRARHGHDPDMYAATGYDAALVIIAAIERVGPTGRAFVMPLPLAPWRPFKVRPGRYTSRKAIAFRGSVDSCGSRAERCERISVGRKSAHGREPTSRRRGRWTDVRPSASATDFQSRNGNCNEGGHEHDTRERALAAIQHTLMHAFHVNRGEGHESLARPWLLDAILGLNPLDANHHCAVGIGGREPAFNRGDTRAEVACKLRRPFRRQLKSNARVRRDERLRCWLIGIARGVERQCRGTERQRKATKSHEHGCHRQSGVRSPGARATRTYVAGQLRKPARSCPTT